MPSDKHEVSQLIRIILKSISDDNNVSIINDRDRFDEVWAYVNRDYDRYTFNNEKSILSDHLSKKAENEKQLIDDAFILSSLLAFWISHLKPYSFFDIHPVDELASNYNIDIDDLKKRFRKVEYNERIPYLNETVALEIAIILVERACGLNFNVARCEEVAAKIVIMMREGEVSKTSLRAMIEIMFSASNN